MVDVSKLTAGMKVKIRSDLLSDYPYSATYFNVCMEQYRGKVLIVEQVRCGQITFLEAGSWTFSPEMCECIVEDKKFSLQVGMRVRLKNDKSYNYISRGIDRFNFNDKVVEISDINSNSFKIEECHLGYRYPNDCIKEIVDFKLPHKEEKVVHTETIDRTHIGATCTPIPTYADAARWNVPLYETSSTPSAVKTESKVEYKPKYDNPRLKSRDYKDNY
jgi:hypothetical protein